MIYIKKSVFYIFILVVLVIFIGTGFFVWNFIMENYDIIPLGKSRAELVFFIYVTGFIFVLSFGIGIISASAVKTRRIKRAGEMAESGMVLKKDFFYFLGELGRVFETLYETTSKVSELKGRRISAQISIIEKTLSIIEKPAVILDVKWEIRAANHLFITKFAPEFLSIKGLSFSVISKEIEHSNIVHELESAKDALKIQNEDFKGTFYPAFEKSSGLIGMILVIETGIFDFQKKNTQEMNKKRKKKFI